MTKLYKKIVCRIQSFCILIIIICFIIYIYIYSFLTKPFAVHTAADRPKLYGPRDPIWSTSRDLLASDHSNRLSLLENYLQCLTLIPFQSIIDMYLVNVYERAYIFIYVFYFIFYYFFFFVSLVIIIANIWTTPIRG